MNGTLVLVTSMNVEQDFFSQKSKKQTNKNIHFEKCVN